MPIKIQLRRDTAANWTSANPTLLSGEAGFETDTGKLKLGDGSTAWTSLAYFAGSGSFTLTDGNGTTANGTAVDLGGDLTAPVDIDGAQPVVFGGTIPLSAFSHYVQVGDRLLTFESDAGIVNIDAYDEVEERGGYFYPGDYDGSGDMGNEMGAYSSLNIIKFSINALTGIVTLVSDYAASVFNFVGVTLNLAKGTDIASATTTDIGAATGNYVYITGTTTITGLGTVQAGATRIVTFTGILTLTHNATSLILPTGANITTAAGDSAEFVSLGSGNWKCTNYQRADGTPLAGGGGGGTWGSITGTLSSQTDLQTALDGKVNDTGDETIAGVKTFSSDPIIPDEAYGSGWNGTLEPPTKNAVYDKIEQIGTANNLFLYYNFY